MKRVFYIGIAVFGLALASCSKQDIKPTTSSDPVVPLWKSNTNDPNEGVITADPTNEGGITDPVIDGNDQDITDPTIDG